MRSIVTLLCLMIVIAILLIVFAKHSQPLSGWIDADIPDDENPSEDEDDGEVTELRHGHLEEPEGEPGLLIECDTAGKPTPPDQVMVHVYNWSASGGYRYQGTKPLRDYAIELGEPFDPPPLPQDSHLGGVETRRLPSAGEIF